MEHPINWETDRPSDGALLAFDVAEALRIYKADDAQAKLATAMKLHDDGAAAGRVLAAVLRTLGATSEEFLRARVADFYATHAPEQQHKVDRVTQLGADPQELVCKLHEKYSVPYPPAMQSKRPTDDPLSSTLNGATALLHDVHRAARGRQTAESLKLAETAAAAERKRRRAVVQDPYRGAVEAVTNAAFAACVTADRAIIAAIDAMDSLSLMSDVERGLLLGDAALVSAQQQLAQIKERLVADAAALRGRVHIADLIAHHVAAVEHTDACVAAALRLVKLTREEADVYRAQAQLNSRLGVLVCEDWSVAAAASKSSSPLSDNPVATTAATVRSLVDAAAQHRVVKSGGGAVAGLLTKGAAAVAGVGVEGAQQLRARFGKLQQQQQPPPSGDAAAVFVAKGATQAPVTLAPYTPDECAALQSEHAELLERQRSDAAKEARTIEAAARDISRLSSLLNEKLAEQSESLLIVEQDTSSSVDHLVRAAEELRKPAASWWNSTRTLIAALWLGTVTILTANHIVR